MPATDLSIPSLKPRFLYVRLNADRTAATLTLRISLTPTKMRFQSPEISGKRGGPRKTSPCPYRALLLPTIRSCAGPLATNTVGTAIASSTGGPNSEPRALRKARTGDADELFTKRVVCCFRVGFKPIRLDVGVWAGPALHCESFLSRMPATARVLINRTEPLMRVDPLIMAGMSMSVPICGFLG